MSEFGPPVEESTVHDKLVKTMTAEEKMRLLKLTGGLDPKKPVSRKQWLGQKDSS